MCVASAQVGCGVGKHHAWMCNNKQLWAEERKEQHPYDNLVMVCILLVRVHEMLFMLVGRACSKVKLGFEVSNIKLFNMVSAGMILLAFETPCGRRHIICAAGIATSQSRQ